MANSNATQLNINLQDSLNLNTNKAEISDFAGFNRRNAPFFNGGLSPLFKQEKTGTVIDKEGNVYSYTNKQFKKNDEILFELGTYENQRKLVKTKIDMPSDNCLYVQDKYGQPIWFDFTDYKLHYGNSVDTVHYSENPNNYFLYTEKDIVVFIYIDTSPYVTDSIFVFNTRQNPEENYLSNAMNRVTTAIWDNKDIKYFRIVYVNSNTVIIQPGLDGCNANEIGDVSKVCKPLIMKKSSSNAPFEKIEMTESYIALPYYQVVDQIWFINPDFKNGTFNYLYSITISESSYVLTPFKSVTIANILENNTYILMDEYRVIVNGICKHNNNPVTISIDSSQIDALNRQNKDMVVFGAGCGAPNENGVYDNFTRNTKYYFGDIVNYTYWGVLYNNNSISGISLCDTLLTSWLDVDQSFTPLFNSPIDRDTAQDRLPTAGFIIYKSASDKNYYKISTEDTDSNPITIIEDRYVVVNVANYRNAYDIKTKKLCHVFDDWNNRLSLGSGTVGNPYTHPVFTASAIKANYEIEMDPNISAIFGPVISYCAMKNGTKIFQPFTTTNIPDSGSDGDINIQELDCYVWFENTATVPVYTGTYKMLVTEQHWVGFHVLSEPLIKKTQLLNVTYPISADGNAILTPSLLATFFDSQIGADYIKDGRYYNLIYYEGLPILAYYYGSGVANSEARFVIQGQSFVIRNGLIYSTTYNNGLMYINNAIVNVDDLQFIGCLPLAAFFFSPATKCVLAFTGDRNLSTAFEATELKSVLNYKYAPNDNSLYLATEDAVYVLFNTPDGTSFVYKIEEQNVTDFVPQDNGCIALKTGNTWKIFSFYERPDFVRVPLKLTTKFFGAGLNRVSTVDCWYIRAFTEKAEKGKIKVKVQTLTNKSCTSEEQEFLINKEDWDANNGFIYLRYQPKLQRSVGVSLELESDFSIYDIQASIKADSTIQITSEKGF